MVVTMIRLVSCFDIDCLCALFRFSWFDCVYLLVSLFGVVCGLTWVGFVACYCCVV